MRPEVAKVLALLAPPSIVPINLSCCHDRRVSPFIVPLLLPLSVVVHLPLSVLCCFAFLYRL
ncbi:glutamine--fructose-6-phosphate transaminase [Sesbania bispinosa]|nr:glutamine--fructose-6-phosphate transaminase [Sesbania bispinosa]